MDRETAERLIDSYVGGWRDGNSKRIPQGSIPIFQGLCAMGRTRGRAPGGGAGRRVGALVRAFVVGADEYEVIVDAERGVLLPTASGARTSTP